MKNGRLILGKKAPAFDTHDIRGRSVKLIGTHPGVTLLSFFRYASCPLCNLRIRELIQTYDQFISRGIRILAVLQSPSERIAHYVERQSPPFSLIPDPDLRLYQMYGVESSWQGFATAWTVGIPRVFKAVVANGFLPGSVENELNRIPADFLINHDGQLTDVYYGRDIGDHMPLQRIFAACD
ncbi:MAG: peroxiredoxin-like family protein [Candidatus Thiodiazotropha sp. DIVDIV]